MNPDELIPRQAGVSDADDLARLLHDFNVEFDTPSPGPEVLAGRLRRLLAGPETFVVLAGAPPVSLAVVTLRPNVWYDGPVALLDEMYVVPSLRGRGIGSAVIGRMVAIARSMGVERIEINVDEGDVDAHRFYEHHGFSSPEAGETERAFCYAQELEPGP